jgi:hypothetical protein
MSKEGALVGDTPDGIVPQGITPVQGSFPVKADVARLVGVRIEARSNHLTPLIPSQTAASGFPGAFAPATLALTEEDKPVFGESSPTFDDPRPPFGAGNTGPVGEDVDPGFRTPFGRRSGGGNERRSCRRDRGDRPLHALHPGGGPVHARGTFLSHDVFGPSGAVHGRDRWTRAAPTGRSDAFPRSPAGRGRGAPVVFETTARTRDFRSDRASVTSHVPPSRAPPALMARLLRLRRAGRRRAGTGDGALAGDGPRRADRPATGRGMTPPVPGAAHRDRTYPQPMGLPPPPPAISCGPGATHGGIAWARSIS